MTTILVLLLLAGLFGLLAAYSLTAPVPHDRFRNSEGFLLHQIRDVHAA